MQNVWTGTAFYEKTVAAIPLQQTRGESSSFHKAPQMVKHSEDIVSYFHALVKWTVQQSDTCQIKRKCAFWYAPIGFLDVCLTWEFFYIGILRFLPKRCTFECIYSKKIMTHLCLWHEQDSCNGSKLLQFSEKSNISVSYKYFSNLSFLFLLSEKSTQ